MEDRTLWSLKRRGCNYQQIASITGLSEEEIRGRMRVRKPGEGEPGNGDPNELMIQLVASAIRLSWSPEEHNRRRSLPNLEVQYGDPVSLDVPYPSRN